MKPPFNFKDKKYEKGFCLDTSKLTPEQLEHFHAIMNARGFSQLNDAGEPQRHFAYVDIAGQTITWYHNQVGELIGYYALCRAAVQLESDHCMVSDLNNCNRIWELTKSIGLTVATRRSAIEDALRWTGYCLESRGKSGLIIKTSKEISPEKFERKLLGIDPLAKQVPATEKPDIDLNERVKEIIIEIFRESKAEWEAEQNRIYSTENPFGNLRGTGSNFGSKTSFKFKSDGVNRPTLKPEDTHGHNEIAETEKPRYLKSNNGDGLILKWISDIPSNSFKAIVVDGGNTNNAIGDGEGFWWNKNGFEPCDYTPVEKTFDGLRPEDTHAHNEADEPEKPRYLKTESSGLIVEYIKDVSENNFKGIVIESGQTSWDIGSVYEDWLKDCFEPCDYTPEDKPFEFAIEPVEVSPETEQPTEKMENCLDKKLSDNPTLADSIGSHMQLAWDYSKKLVNENTRLRAQLYRLPLLEQENAQQKETIEKMQIELAKVGITKRMNEMTGKSEQLPVYDIEWLCDVVNELDGRYTMRLGSAKVYAMFDAGSSVSLDLKTSADIAINAVAKSLNGNWKPDWNDPKQNKWCITAKGAKRVQTANYGQPVFKDGETCNKAIQILNAIEPEIIKNHLL